MIFDCLSNKTIQSHSTMCRFYQSSKRIDPVYMKFYSPLYQIYQFTHSTRWFCLMVWYFQTENLCSTWLSCVLSDFYDPQYIDSRMRLVLLHYWCPFLIQICLFFNMLFDLLRPNMFSRFNHFLQVNNCSQLLQSCPW